MKKLLCLLVCGLMMITMTACSSSDLKDGTYSGVGKGKGGDLNVEITIANKEITDITFGEHHEDYTDAMESIKANVLAKNSLEVDNISGATYTSNGVIEALKDAVSKAGDASLLVAKDGVVETEEREDSYNADVIVLGAGGAGLTAAIEAANNGASVIVVEKMSTCGGNTAISGGEMAAPGNWLQKTKGIEDSAENFYNDIMKGGDNESDPELAKVVAYGALEAANWLKDTVGVEFEDHMYFFGGHSVERSLVPNNATGFEITTKLEAKAKELGVIIHTNTAASTLTTLSSNIFNVVAAVFV